VNSRRHLLLKHPASAISQHVNHPTIAQLNYSSSTDVYSILTLTLGIPFSPFPSSLSSLPFLPPLRSKRRHCGYKVWGEHKLPQRVRAECGRQTYFGAF